MPLAEKEGPPPPEDEDVDVELCDADAATVDKVVVADGPTAILAEAVWAGGIRGWPRRGRTNPTIKVARHS